jgi:hypoxanthine-guanine phosphoribosyltransferase/tRNA(Arg) A34 adenosine deaminase TadA
MFVAGNSRLGTFSGFVYSAEKGVGSGINSQKDKQTIADQVEDFLKRNLALIPVGSKLYFATKSLEQALIANKEGNYGIGSSVVVKHEGKIYVFNDRNAMITGRGVHDHAEARAIFRAARLKKEILEGVVLPESEQRAYGLNEADEVYDAGINHFSNNLDDGIHVFGTLEPCLMCMCIACRAGAKSSVSNALDGECVTIENGKISSGGGYVIGDKLKIIPQVCQWIIDAQGLEFKLLETDDSQLELLSRSLSDKNDPTVHDRSTQYLKETENKYSIGQPEYYARAALSEAVKALDTNNDPRGAVAVLVKNGEVFEFRSHDMSESGLGVKDIAASRVLEAARAFDQDYLIRLNVPDEEKIRFQPKMPDKRYPKSTNEFTSDLSDGLYLYTTIEPDPQAMFVAMNAKVNTATCNAEDGEIIDSKDVVKSMGAAVAIGKLGSLPFKWQLKIKNSGITYQLLEASDDEDPSLVEELKDLSERIFSDTREEIDTMLSKRGNIIVENVPTEFKIAFTSGDIDVGIQSVAGQINSWIEDIQSTGGNIILLTNLTGGENFASDLKKLLPLDVSQAHSKTSAYVKSDRVGKKDKNVTVDFCSINENLVDERTHILIVDDICDSGDSLQTLKNYLIEKFGISPDKIKSTTLLKRENPTSKNNPDWFVFEVSGTSWFVGRGMQFGGNYRSCSNIYTYEPTDN